MATGLELARRGRLRHWLHSDAPASRGAQVFMFVAALLCGAALSGLLFVGVWRHTAGEAAQSQAARAGDQRALGASRRENGSLKVRLAHEQALLGTANRAHTSALAALSRAQSALAQARAELTRTKTADGAALHAASVRASALTADANALARATATLRSELTALETYAQNPGPTGIDPGYLANQVHYLEASAAAASSAANDLASRASG